MKTEEFYSRIRVAGLLAIIPIVLATGPLGGYLIADLVVEKLGFPHYTTVICVILGFIASIQEIIKIIRIAIKSKG